MSLARFALLALLCVGAYTNASETTRYSREQAMTIERLNGIDIAYTTAGSATDPAVLFIMGLGASHLLWGEDFINGIVDAGYRVVLFDNRDTGQSSTLEELGEPWLWWEFIKLQLGFELSAPYTLSDMADDAVAVLDTLEIEQAHIVGASMGGMIAQVLSAEHPERVRTLVSIMSSTGAEHLPAPSNEASESLQNAADPGSDVAANLTEMGFFPEAMPRQILAIFEAGDRTEQVATISAPTLVLHGAKDELLKPEHGEHTAELIEGAQLVIYPDMGHNMPPKVVPELTADMVQHLGAY